MRRLIGLCGVAILVIIGGFVAARDKAASENWKAVESAMEKRRPRTAIQALEPIVDRTLKARDHDEATKAVALQIMLESQIQGGKAEERISRLEKRMTELPEAMQPMMEAVLANWYWTFFQQNKWRFVRRTQTDQPPGEDILAWDLPRILSEIDSHFQAALEAEQWLQETSVAEFDELLTEGSMPDSYRPTLFDVLVYNALRFYSAGEQAGAAAEDAYVLQASSPILSPPKDFLAWQIKSTDTDSPTIRAVHLYQRLMRFHKAKQHDMALAEADLSRLKFGYNKAFGEDKNARYKAALGGFVEHWKNEPISARALAAHAQVLQSEQLMTDAHRLAERGWNAFPESVGGKQCYNVLQQIEAKEIDVKIERVWNNPWPSISVNYRNLTKVYFRAVRYDWLELIERTNYHPGSINSELRGELLKRSPALEWSHDLPATEDYLPNEARFEVPDNLESGFYFLIASPNPAFRERDNRVLAREFFVSPLALVLRTGSSNALEGFVLNADTGRPIEGATVRPWIRKRVVRKQKWVEQENVRTNGDGQFRIDGTARQSYVILVEHEGHKISTHNAVRGHGRHGEPDAFNRTIFFTDRSLYRPGQTIRFKGICVSVDQQRDNYETIEEKPINVVFEDANGQKISEKACRTNAFGAFNGSFTAPRDRLTGRMVLRDEADRSSRTYINVEEYKRPKFKVELEAPEEAVQLGEKVHVPGTAKAYTGAAIGNAQVQYRVVREVRYPIWWRWRCWWNPPRREAQEIAHGSTTTESDGSFTVPFVASPDPSVAEKNEPIFRFTIHADVTDTTGETRSDKRGISIGYTSLRASMSTDDWLVAGEEIKIRINTQSPDGEPRAAQGTVKIHELKQPARVHRARLLSQRPGPYRGHAARGGTKTPRPDLSDPNAWPLGPVVAERSFGTDAGGSATKRFELSAGPYRAVLETKDNSGKDVSAILPLQVLKPTADRLAIKVPHLVAAPAWSLEPGETFTALWGTGYEAGRAFIEVEHRGKIVQSYWTRSGVTQATVEQGVTEAMRGGFTLHVTQVRENRAYVTSRKVDVPWTNKQLDIQWEHFVSKLKPGHEETWKAVITGPDSEAAAAEMVAALYDASLDAYLPHNWPNLNLFRQDRSRLRTQFQNVAFRLQNIMGHFYRDHKSVTITYDSFPPDILGRVRAVPRGMFGAAPGAARGRARATRAMETNMADDSAALAEAAEALPTNGMAMKAGQAMGGMGGGGKPAKTPKVDLDQVTARENLSETAFFMPHLKTDNQGRVTMTFTMPEALTEWKFLGFAHDRHLRGGSLTDTAVTSKDLMVEPLAPRFVREGDVLEFTVKVTNQSPTRQTGQVRLSFSDARTTESVDDQLGNTRTDRSFDIPSKQSESFAWRLEVPDAMGFLTYKAVGSTGRLSDGEEGYLPVLSRRILVTESLSLPIRDAGTKKFEFTKLLNSGESDSLDHQSLTVQMVSNPAWYAVMALPYLMEYPHECTEQVFNRLYANVLARRIANSDPKIRRVFDQWKATPALDSPLEKNEDLKAVMLEETPWVRQAKKESEARRNVGILFDANRLNNETTRALRKLTELQAADGSWPWFPGGRPNDYITLYITTGFGRLRHLGVDIDVSPAVKSLARLDSWIHERYQQIVEDGNEEENHLTHTICLYLYGRSFFLEDQPIAAEHQQAVDYFLGQSRAYWPQLNCRQSEAHAALALKRFGNRQTARDIMISLKERSVSDEEMGMFWRDTEYSWWWYRAPIETQALMIEAFDEVMNDIESVKACRVWLLKQKQTQDWKTTKATADAVYSLLLRGNDLLASDELVKVALGGQTIEPRQVEAGTGYYEERFLRDEIQPSMGQVTVTKKDPGVAWGSLHWQYLEDMSKVTPYQGTPLTLEKRLYVKENSKQGPVLKAVNGPVSVGDELVVRLELRVDRDMEYVHLKDQRGSGLEPVNVLSRYRYQDGLAYYESTRDTASHFFIDYLPKGTYVFEYSTRVVHRGSYQSGMATIQCMYAPEFNSHSESLLIEAE